MVGKNNKKLRLEQSGEKKWRYAFKKGTAGIVSVAVASLLFVGGGYVAGAEETEIGESTTEKVVSEKDETDEGSEEIDEKEETSDEENKETEETEETQTLKEVGNDPSLVIDEIVEDETYGEKAYEHTEYLSEEIGKRVVGTEGEELAREYILEQLKSYGYTPVLDEFTFVSRDEKEYTSSNIIVVKDGVSTDEIIVGAHYDSVPENKGTGADDNASSVGVLLETAERLYGVDVPYTLKLVFFGAEEVGLKGSKHYAQTMTEEEVANTIGMVNMDSLIAGDKTYIHGGANGEVWFRDQAFDVATEMGIDTMEANPGLNEDYPYGTTGPFSDHAYFDQLGLPIMYFEASNWEIADLDGYDQTEDNGPIWHTDKDTLEFLNKTYPGRAQEHLQQFAGILYNFLTNVTAPKDTITRLEQKVERLKKEVEELAQTGEKQAEEIKALEQLILDYEKRLNALKDCCEGKTDVAPEDDPVDEEDGSEEETDDQQEDDSAAESDQKKLPETGEASAIGLAVFSLLSGLGLAAPTFKKRK